MLTLVSALLLVVKAGHADGEPETASRIEFVTHPSSDQGQVVCGLFVQDGWLKRPVKPAWVRIQGKRAVCTFVNVKPGTYGMSAYHDANNNGKLDTNAIGLPTEDYCASRDARGTFGPPSFDDAKFEYRSGVLRLSARLH